MASKIGRNKKVCEEYRRSGRRQINKDLKAEKHLARIEHFAKRKGDGKSYEYQPPKTKKEKYLRSKKNVDRRLPIAKQDSIFAKLNNEIQKQKILSKKRGEKKINVE